MPSHRIQGHVPLLTLLCRSGDLSWRKKSPTLHRHESASKSHSSPKKKSSKPIKPHGSASRYSRCHSSHLFTIKKSSLHMAAVTSSAVPQKVPPGGCGMRQDVRLQRCGDQLAEPLPGPRPAAAWQYLSDATRIQGPGRSIVDPCSSGTVESLLHDTGSQVRSHPIPYIPLHLSELDGKSLLRSPTIS